MITEPRFEIKLDSAQDLDLDFLKLIQAKFKAAGIELIAEPKMQTEKKKERWIIRAKDRKRYRIIKSGFLLQVYQGDSRHYTSTPLPTLKTDFDEPLKSDVLLKLYSEVSSNWRMLTDVRFKLLGFVPAISLIAWIQLIAKDDFSTLQGRVEGLAVSILGLILVLAIRIYDLRNDTLYNDLISRGRRIETELGVDTAIFRGRRKPNNNFIKHGVATNLIYGIAIFGWSAIAIWFLISVLLQ